MDITNDPLKFFTDGYKPSILLGNSTDQQTIEDLKKKGYPSTRLINRCTLFFQTADKCNEFENKYRQEKRNNRSFDLLAEHLGLPPCIVEFLKSPSMEPEEFVIDYYGITFTSPLELVNESLIWLRKTYRVPSNYPGYIEIVDRRDISYRITSEEITNFKPLPITGLFANKMTPIFLVTTTFDGTNSQTIYNGNDVNKALRVVSRNKESKPVIDVWIADKLAETFTLSTLDSFKEKYNKKSQ